MSAPIPYAVTDPSTGAVLETHPFATDGDVAAALAAAEQAYRTWTRTSTVSERTALAQRAAGLHRQRADILADSIHRETGKPVDEARAEVESAAAKTEAFVNHAEEWLADEILEVADGRRTVVKTRGTGVILGIMPWNYPVTQVARFAAANLILGNTVIVSLTEQCPRTAFLLADLYRDAGFPDGTYVNLFTTHEQVAEIIADPRVQGVSLTGSERVGTVVAARAGRHLKKCVLELGGFDPFLVLDPCNVDHAVAQAVAGRMENNGQACNGSKRIIVVSSLYEEFAKKFTAEMVRQPTRPLASAAAAQRLAGQVQRALDQGALLLTGSATADGACVPPGVLADITPEMDVHREELFGPVAQLS